MSTDFPSPQDTDLDRTDRLPVLDMTLPLHQSPQPRVSQLQSEVAWLRAHVAALEAELGTRKIDLESTRNTASAVDALIAPEVSNPPVEHSSVRSWRRPARERSVLPSRYLVSREGERDIRHPLRRRTIIGRTSDCDIRIDTKHASRHHAVVLCTVRYCVIEDLHSTNGVRVNDRLVSRRVLRDGDQLHIANTLFTFRQSE
jgi:hypothetical protein